MWPCDTLAACPGCNLGFTPTQLGWTPAPHNHECRIRLVISFDRKWKVLIETGWTVGRTDGIVQLLSASIAMKPNPSTHPDMLKSLIQMGFYKLLNWLTISSQHRKLIPDGCFYLPELDTKKKGYGVTIWPQGKATLYLHSSPTQSLNLYNGLRNKAKTI